MVFTTVAAIAHPLGNFTINHFVRIQLERERVGIHYAVDTDEIPTFRSCKRLTLMETAKASSTELNAYLERVTPQYVDGIMLTGDGSQIMLKTITKQVTTLP